MLQSSGALFGSAGNYMLLKHIFRLSCKNIRGEHFAEQPWRREVNLKYYDSTVACNCTL